MDRRNGSPTKLLEEKHDINFFPDIEEKSQKGIFVMKNSAERVHKADKKK